ncbi:hypothetical protein BSY19_631 [Bosea sp. RAC05]|jgi:hypothetical protein|nr:hypothetical protein BSY19_631 [Bosea sp. RAC05]
MGIRMDVVHIMEGYGILGAGRKILDFGSSNLYGATAEQIIAFVKRHNANPRADLESWAARLAAGSGTDAGGTNLNGSFFGELIEEAGMGYDAIDIADGYKTTIVDLNSMRLPDHMVGAYDSVINCGTSEHILNQMNTFLAVHVATKAGGLIMHQVPSVGYVDHGYFCYTSRFFFDLAGYNQYEVVDMWYDGPAAQENVFASARQYQSYFPSLTSRLDKIGKVERETMQDQLNIPTISIALVYRKHQDVPFMGTVETSTSVGAVPTDVLGTYQR